MICIQNIRNKCLLPIIILFGGALFVITFKKRPHIHQNINFLQSVKTIVGLPSSSHNKQFPPLKDDADENQHNYEYQDSPSSPTNGVKPAITESKHVLIQ